MRYALITTDSTVRRVVSENSGAYIETPASLRIALADDEWCEPRALYRPYDSPRFVAAPRSITRTSYEFLNRFTDSELMAVRAKSQTDAAAWKFLTFATAAQEVISDDPMTVAGMDYLVLIGVLSQTRRNEILGG